MKNARWHPMARVRRNIRAAVREGRKRSSESRVVPRSKRARITRTLTTTRRQTPSGVRNTGFSGSFSSFNRRSPGRSLVARLKRGIAPSIYSRNVQALLSGAPGLQSVNWLNQMWPRAICQNLALQAAQLEDPATPGRSHFRTDKILFESCKYEIAFTNAENFTLRVTLYDLVSKRDIGVYQTSGGGAATADPVEAWEEGIINESQNTGGASYIGSFPTDSQLFKAYWRIRKTTKLELGAGQTHYHRGTITPNYLMNGETLYIDNQQGLRGLYGGTLVVLSGQPVLDGAGTGATTAQVRMLHVCKQDYTTRYLSNTTSTLKQVNSTLSTTMNATKAAINIEQGVPDNIDAVFG